MILGVTGWGSVNLSHFLTKRILKLGDSEREDAGEQLGSPSPLVGTSTKYCCDPKPFSQLEVEVRGLLNGLGL